MRKRPVRSASIDMSSIDLPDNYHKIVVQQNKSTIIIRNSSATADSSIENKQRMLMSKIYDFFGIRNNFEQLITLLEQSTPISLRLLDWVVTNYCKKNTIFLKVIRNGVVENINLFLDYKAHLKSFSKRSFDPFCRRERIIAQFPIDDQKRKFVTTPAQLNFYKWCIETGVCEFCQQNLQELESDMINNLRVKTDGVRRAEISPCATSVLNIANVNRKVEFT